MKYIYIFILLILSPLTLLYNFPNSYSSFTGYEGVMMQDINGVNIQAHGGQIQKLGSKFYWIGEDKTNDYKPCPGIHMYSSTDLYNWSDEGLVLKTMQSESDLSEEYFYNLYGNLPYETQYAIYEDLWQGDGNDGCVIERPKMLYNSKTKKYVIWFHADGTTPSTKGQSNYGKAKAGIAISDSPTGPFKLLGTYLLVVDDNYSHSWDNVGGHVRDMNLFQDDDGTAYVIYSSDGNTNTYIVKLDSEYTGISKSNGDAPVEGVDYIVTFVGNSREAPAMFKANNQYYMITSGCTGWSPNPAQYAISNSVLGEWKTIGNPCTDDGASTTYNTQSTCVYKVDDGEYIYMGDRWYSSTLRDSRYVWLPIEFDMEGNIYIRKYSNWNLDIFPKIKPFSIITELPTSAESISDLKNNLPEKLKIQYKGESTTQYVDVNWVIKGSDNYIADILVQGSLSNERSIEFYSQIFDPRTIYFFDSGAELYGAGEYYNQLKKKLGSKLLNKVGDQTYIKGIQDGYSSVLGGTNDDVDISYKSGGGEDIWGHGFWAHGGKNIEYSFTLKAGKYVVVEGFYEWWNTTRYMKISVKVGDEVLASSTFTLGKSDTRNQQFVEFTLSEDSVVVISVSKTSGADPVLSWVSILKDA